MSLILRIFGKEQNGSANWTRTSDHSINSRMLYQLSYRGTHSDASETEGEVRVTNLPGFAKPHLTIVWISCDSGPHAWARRCSSIRSIKVLRLAKGSSGALSDQSIRRAPSKCCRALRL